MAEERFNTALENCVTGLANGESLADVLRLYPEFEADLRPLLESGLIVPELQASDVEVALSQARVAERFEAALSAPITSRPNRSWWRVISLSAAMFAIFLFANIALAQNSLPDDWNYGIKRSGEAVVIFMTGNEGQFAERRLNETQLLLASQRAANVTFEGEIIVIDDTQFLIAELTTPIEATTELLNALEVMQRVRIMARTTVDGHLIADHIEILREIETDAEIITSPISIITETETVLTITATTEITRTHTATVTASHTATFTREPGRTATESPTIRETASSTASPGFTPTERPVEADNQATCVVSVPDGWIAYTIQAGDTLFALATRSGTSLETISRVSCIADPSLLSVRQIIYLPPPQSDNPAQSVSPTPENNREVRPTEQASATSPPVRPTETPSRSR